MKVEDIETMQVFCGCHCHKTEGLIKKIEDLEGFSAICSGIEYNGPEFIFEFLTCPECGVGCWYYPTKVPALDAAYWARAETLNFIRALNKAYEETKKNSIQFSSDNVVIVS